MRRADREQDLGFSLALIDRCTHGVLGLTAEDGAPYCLPLSLVRLGSCLYFHCAREGRKVELLRRDGRVCVTFVGEDRPAFVPPAMYTTYFQSVIVTGTATEVQDEAEKVRALRALCEKLTSGDMAAFDHALSGSLPATAVWRIEMENISGKAKRRLT